MRRETIGRDEVVRRLGTGAGGVVLRGDAKRDRILADLEKAWRARRRRSEQYLRGQDVAG